VRIVICDYSGHPFQVELSRSLARRGHAVLHLHFAGFLTPKGQLTVLPGDPPTFEVEGLNLRQPFDKQKFLRRRIWETQFGIVAATRALRFRPDIVVGCNMPLDAQKKFMKLCTAKGIPFVFWLQDIYSKAISHYLGQKLGLIGRLIGAHYIRLEQKLLRRSGAVVAISEKFLATLESWNVARSRISVIPNWAPLSEIYPVDKDNSWSRAHALDDKLIALYTGTLGLKHDPSLISGLAAAGREIGLHVVVASEGPGVEWLAQQKRDHDIANLTLLPFQPMNVYPEVLGAGDILLAMVGEEAAGFSVPSKILSYLASGKPTVASIAPDNDAARMIEEAGAGLVAAPGDRAAFCNAVLTLARDRGLRLRMGEAARQYAEGHFDAARIAARFEEVFSRLLSEHHRPHLRPAQLRLDEQAPQ
jgi:colanic acid biosynthesis glycosyl transferase WcaI